MKRALCELVSNYPTVTILALGCLAVLCLFSTLGTVCFLGIFCILIRSIQKGREEGWLQSEDPQPRRRPRHQSPTPDNRRRTSRQGKRIRDSRVPSYR